ncbi:calcium-binding protein [Streptomyces sp. NPDC059076]|uniref:calcium-binding protein n=1 Tax=unclassified Streptomyces TaxID=2593676 RepID=UPI0036930D3E
MRIRASVAVVTGALALTGLAVPMAHADAGSDSWNAPRSSAKVSAAGAPTISNVVANGGKAIVVGATAKKVVKVTYTVSDPQGIGYADVALWRGSNWDEPTAFLITDGEGATCGTGTKVTCTSTFTIDPKIDLWNDQAGTWKIASFVMDENGAAIERTNVGSAVVQRESKLTVNASPEPVTKDKTITITGSLTRGSWDTNKYVGYGSQSVKLQYLKKGTSAYTTLKTIKADSKGNLKTTVKATADGHYRYVFAGTSTTAGQTAVADYIDVR